MTEACFSIVWGEQSTVFALFSDTPYHILDSGSRVVKTRPHRLLVLLLERFTTILSYVLLSFTDFAVYTSDLPTLPHCAGDSRIWTHLPLIRIGHQISRILTIGGCGRFRARGTGHINYARTRVCHVLLLLASGYTMR